MEALDSGHTTVKTENRDGQPGLNQGQDPSSRVLLRSTRVATPAQCQKDQWASQPGFLAEPRMEMVHAHEIGLAGPVIRIIGQCYY